MAWSKFVDENTQLNQVLIIFWKVEKKSNIKGRAFFLSLFEYTCKYYIFTSSRSFNHEFNHQRSVLLWFFCCILISAVRCKNLRLLMFSILFYHYRRRLHQQRRQRQKIHTFFVLIKRLEHTQRIVPLYFVTKKQHTHTREKRQRERKSTGNEDMSADITSLWRRCTRPFAAEQMKKHKSTW